LRESERAASNTPLGGNGRFVTKILPEGDEGFAIMHWKKSFFIPSVLASHHQRTAERNLAKYLNYSVAGYSENAR
jgi:hypothetical protein